MPSQGSERLKLDHQDREEDLAAVEKGCLFCVYVTVRLYRTQVHGEKYILTKNKAERRKGKTIRL